MLKQHMDAVERTLIAQAGIQGGVGHATNKGTPREAFIREFLQGHLPGSVSIGNGEIVSSASVPGEQRNQFDIVLHKSQFPKLDFGGGIGGFIVESVVSTIEVKSTLDKAGLKQAIGAAAKLKAMPRKTTRVISSGHHPPAPPAFVVAYDGPAKMGTVLDWMGPIHDELGIPVPDLPDSRGDRIRVAGPSIDGVFVLGKGFVLFDNFPLSFLTDGHIKANPDLRWYSGALDAGSLLLLFSLLTVSLSGFAAEWLDPIPYLQDFKADISVSEEPEGDGSTA